MLIIIDPETLCVVRNQFGKVVSFYSLEQAKASNIGNRFCINPLFVEVADGSGSDSIDRPTARAKVAATLKTLADESGGYDVLQNAIDYLRA